MIIQSKFNLLDEDEDTLPFGIYIDYCNVKAIKKEEEFLSPWELNQYKSLKFNRRKYSFFWGRKSAKEILNFIIPNYEKKNWEIRHGIFGQPIIYNPEKYRIPLGVSISHSKTYVGALIFPLKYPMAMDIENLNRLIEPELIFNQCTQNEKDIVFSLFKEEKTTAYCIWTIKEALSKVLKIGLTIDLKLLEIFKIETNTFGLISHFKNFKQYVAISHRKKDFIFSIVIPKQLLKNKSFITYLNNFNS